MKKITENKSRQPQANKGSSGNVLVELLPGRGIGGVGGPGTMARMKQSEAEEYVRIGYVRILQEEPVVVVQAQPGQSDETKE